MDTIRLLVLARPGHPSLAGLDTLEAAAVTVGDHPEAFESAAPQADVILSSLGGRGLLERVWTMAPRVRWVHALSAGVEGLLFPALVASPVPLTNSRGVFSRPLAEFAMAAVFFFAKDLRRMLRSQAVGRWDPFDVGEVHGRTMGIVGYGDIGRAAAAAARPLGMRVLALRRRPERSEGDTLVEQVYPLEQRHAMLSRCDYVVVAMPLTPETRGLIGAAELAAMKPAAVLVNVGRGPVVDEPALLHALETRRIGGAALDVFEREPLPEGHPFFRLDNVLLSPHCADHTPGWLEASVAGFLENLDRFRNGLPLRNVVDKTRGY
jgi:phosphoglycerate dehydrogenase-like enzyme